jgi:hypothetical protein
MTVGPALLFLSGTGPLWAGLTAPIPPHFLMTSLGDAI